MTDRARQAGNLARARGTLGMRRTIAWVQGDLFDDVRPRQPSARMLFERKRVRYRRGLDAVCRTCCEPACVLQLRVRQDDERDAHLPLCRLVEHPLAPAKFARLLELAVPLCRRCQLNLVVPRVHHPQGAVRRAPVDIGPRRLTTTCRGDHAVQDNRTKAPQIRRRSHRCR